MNPAGSKVDLHEMHAYCLREANRLRVMQRMLVEEGHLKSPNPVKTREAEIAEATAKLIEWFRDHENIIRNAVKNHKNTFRKR